MNTPPQELKRWKSQQLPDRGPDEQMTGCKEARHNHYALLVVPTGRVKQGSSKPDTGEQRCVGCYALQLLAT